MLQTSCLLILSSQCSRVQCTYYVIQPTSQPPPAHHCPELQHAPPAPEPQAPPRAANLVQLGVGGGGGARKVGVGGGGGLAVAVPPLIMMSAPV